MSKDEFIGILKELSELRPRINKRVLKRLLDPIMEDMEVFFEFVIFADNIMPRNSKEFQYMVKVHRVFMNDPAYKELRYDAVVGEENKRYLEYREKNYGNCET